MIDSGTALLQPESGRGKRDFMDLLIVEPIEAEVRAWLGARYTVRDAPELARDPVAFRRAIAHTRAVLVPATLPMDATTLHYAPKLRVVGRIAPGTENIDLEACAQARVDVVRSVSASAQAEAEFMLGAVLTMLRRQPVALADGARVGRELGGATIGLVGMVPAARVMSQLLTGFGSRVVGYDPSVHATESVWARWQIHPLGLRQLLAESDVVCVQLAVFSRYRGLLGARLLPHCKSNQVIVSISESGIFDEAALARALDHGIISAAWLDNVEPGALDPGRPLAGVDKLITTPHLASATRESRLRSAWAVARRIDELLTAPAVARPEITPPMPAAAPARAGDPAPR